MEFKFYNLNISQESKLAWEKGEIKNPRFSLKGLDNQNITIDEAEEMLIQSIRDSFSDLREVIHMNEFSDAKIIMPSMQMCSTDGLDVIDFGISIFDKDSDDFIDDIGELPSQLLDEFTYMLNSELYADEYDDSDDYNVGNEESEDDSEDVSEEQDVSEEEDNNLSDSELDIIKKSINGDK